MTVSITQLISFPLLFNILVIAVCWIYYLFRDGTHRSSPVRNRIYRCQVCAHVYLDARDVPLARCPRCGCLNEAIKT